MKWIWDFGGKNAKRAQAELIEQKKLNDDIALKNLEAESMLNALSASQAIIEFNMNGTIITANDNFLNAMGYKLSEIKGKHHRLFMPEELKNTQAYRDFWKKLNSGEFTSGEYKRITKEGGIVWIQATYNPIFDLTGKPTKVVKVATDVTAQKLANANFEGQIDAIHKSQAVIEFNMDGTIITANQNFLSAMGYSLSEIQGQHHSIFTSEAFKNSDEYRHFWHTLNQGEFAQGEYKRITKSGQEIWIQATYNPILDLNGKPYKVVKFANDVTNQKLANANFEGQIAAINKSQAVIEFNMDGTIITANDAFLETMSYSLEEIKNQHHRMFAPDDLKDSVEYQNFWQNLNQGHFASGEYKRIAKNGREIWIQASYNPIFDLNGKPFKVVKFATDITEQKLANANFEGQIEAIDKVQAVIEFNMDGTIITANQNFLDTMGYSLDEIKGQHHRIFAPDELKSSQEYQDFWLSLNQGSFATGEYKRITKNGSEVWIQASYNPILDLNGRPYKVVKFALDITKQKLSNANFEGQIAAIDLAQAVIEFNMDGTIITANQNFLDTTGYSINEIQGQHHSMFMPNDLKNTAQYQEFWHNLNHGKFASGEYKRIGKNGQEIWIQASYNPIFDLNGKPFKVVKFATDVTKQKLINTNFEGQIDAISKSQAVIEFNMDGTIICANDNFLNTLGYQLDEIQGKHHSMFAPAELKGSSEYQAFWQKLNRGEFEAGEYKRIAKDGHEIWIQASYNPIFDLNGKPFKVVKFATDVTDRKVAINEVSRVLMELAKGDLTESIEQSFSGEFNALKDAVNTTFARLKETVQEVTESAHLVATGSNEIAQGNSDLSQRTEEQASSLEETASSMEQMIGTVAKNADNAKIAANLSLDAKAKAQDGGVVVESAINSMDDINQASKKISDIISVIDEIAFQTNLLALNAAVEAARAGEQGRGFAVVAGEVRNLAQRSAGAAKEIKELIRDSITKVEEGSILVNQSGDTLREIISAVEKVNTMIEGISAASDEQRTDIEQVNKAITQMDEMTQQNAALVEQASAASETIVDQVNGMNERLSFFKVEQAHLNLGLPTSKDIVIPAASTIPTVQAKRIANHYAPPPSTLAFEANQDSGEQWEEF